MYILSHVHEDLRHLEDWVQQEAWCLVGRTSLATSHELQGGIEGAYNHRYGVCLCYNTSRFIWQKFCKFCSSCKKKARMMVVARPEHDTFAVYALGFQSHAYYHGKTWQTMQVIMKISLQISFKQPKFTPVKLAELDTPSLYLLLNKPTTCMYDREYTHLASC